MEGQTALTVSQRGTDSARRWMTGRALALIPRNGTGPTTGTQVNAFQCGLPPPYFLCSAQALPGATTVAEVSLERTV